MPVSRLVRRINKTTPDLIFVAGDFIYFLDPAQFKKHFSAFVNANAPVYAVLGNHDLGLPGPDLREALSESLPNYGIQLIDDSALDIAGDGFDFELVALSDSWNKKQDLALLDTDPARPRIVLTHNPATVRDLRPGNVVDFLMGGHTHGGQIYLPPFSCKLNYMCGPRRYGLSKGDDAYTPRHPSEFNPPIDAEAERPNPLIFTTSGTGMVGLPMRFLVPPRIDILNVEYSACAPNDGE